MVAHGLLAAIQGSTPMLKLGPRIADVGSPFAHGNYLIDAAVQWLWLEQQTSRQMLEGGSSGTDLKTWRPLEENYLAFRTQPPHSDWSQA